jgi:hypothetical protein
VSLMPLISTRLRLRLTFRGLLLDAARHGGAAAAGAQQAAKEAGSTAINKAKASFGGMTIQEARQILNVRDNATLHDIEKVRGQRHAGRCVWLHVSFTPCHSADIGLTPLLINTTFPPAELRTLI